MATGFDWGSALNAAGAIAGAWGQYETGKEYNKIKKEQLAYEKQKDAAYQARIDEAQVNLDDAFGDSVLNTKKKKNPDGTDVAEPMELV